MNEYTTRKIDAFTGTLQKLGLHKMDILGICSMLQSEEMLNEMMQELEAKECKPTPEEAIMICGTVIQKYAGRRKTTD